MWFILDRKEKRIGVIDVELLDGLPLLSDNLTERLEKGYDNLVFSVPSNHPKTELIQNEGFIIHVEGSKMRQFRIKEIDDSHGEEMTMMVYTEPSATADLMGKIVRAGTSYNSQSLKDVAKSLLLNTDWELGESFYDDLVTISFSEEPTVLEALHTLIEVYNAEIEFVVEFNGQKIVRKLVNFYEKRGNKTNVIFEYESNLQGVKRKEDTNKLYTALLVRGKEEDGVKISIANATKTPKSPFTLVGEVLQDNEALEKYGGKSGIHVEGRYVDSMASNPNELLRNAEIELEKWNHPINTYTVDAKRIDQFVGYSFKETSIGDTIMIKDETFNPPLYLNGRILEKQSSQVNIDMGTITLGDYVRLEVSPNILIKQLQRKIETSEDAWNKSAEVAQDAIDKAQDAIDRVENIGNIAGYQVKIVSTNGIAFKNGDVQTSLITTVYKGTEDVTTTLPLTSFIWEKFKIDGTSDTAWNTAHKGLGRTIPITGADIYEKATFICKIEVEKKVIGMDSITLFDMKDSIMSGQEPDSPIEGQIWIDQSIEPLPMIKRFDGLMWVEIGELTTELSTELNKLNEKLTNMTDDRLLDVKERSVIKADLMNIVGFAIADSDLTLPTTLSMDTLNKGTFATVRKNAVASGLLTDNPAYLELTNQYNNLKSYLELITPVKPWDASEGNRLQSPVIVRDTFRSKWLQYQIAVNSLERATTEQLKKNADNIQVGGRNYIRNSTFRLVDMLGVLFDWREVHASYEVIEAEADKPKSNILHIVKTGNTQTWNYSALSNTTPAKIGDIFTISFDLKVADIAVWDVKKALSVEFCDSTGAIVQTVDMVLPLNTVVNNTWVRLSMTVKVTNATVASGQLRLVLPKNGELFFREVQMEKGTVATDYKLAPEDSDDQITLMENKISGIEQLVTNDGIVSTVMESVTFQERLSEKANADSIGDLATKEELGNAVEEVNQETVNKINGIDFAPYAKQADLLQTSQDITAKIQAGGGVNVLLNSIGFKGTEFWTLNGTMKTNQPPDLKQLGLNSGFYSPTGTTGYIEQAVDVIAGQSYTLSAFIKKVGDSTTNAHAQVLIYENGSVVATLGLNNSQGQALTFTKYQTTYKTKSSRLIIRVTAGANTEASFSGIMLNIGLTPFQWTMATGEIYNTNLKIDLSGLTVNQISNGVETGRTKMTPSKFAGYFDVDGNGVIDESDGSVDEVFRMDRDEFVMKKANVKDEITLGAFKVLNLTNPTFTGWVWVAND